MSLFFNLVRVPESPDDRNLGTSAAWKRNLEPAVTCAGERAAAEPEPEPLSAHLAEPGTWNPGGVENALCRKNRCYYGVRENESQEQRWGGGVKGCFEGDLYSRGRGLSMDMLKSTRGGHGER